MNRAMASAMLLSVAWLACGAEVVEAEPEPGCSADPWACDSGTTCWVRPDQETFECLPAGDGSVDDACVYFGGQPTCTAGFTCFQAEGQAEGVCRPFCGDGHACADGECRMLLYPNGLIIDVCEPIVGGGGSG